MSNDNNNMKLIENFMICTYKVIYDDNKLDEIINELKEKYYELKKESIYSLYDIQTITNIYNQNHHEAIELLYIVEEPYNIESEYSRVCMENKYNIVYKKYSILQYLINKKNSSILFDLYDYVNSIYTVHSNISEYFSDKPYIGPEQLNMLLSSITGVSTFVYDSYISKEEKDKYINEILGCIKLELIESKEITDKREFDIASDNTVKYKLITEDYGKVDNKVKVK